MFAVYPLCWGDPAGLDHLVFVSRNFGGCDLHLHFANNVVGFDDMFEIVFLKLFCVYLVVLFGCGFVFAPLPCSA